MSIRVAPRSLRWRLQLWQGFLAASLMTGFGFTVYQLQTVNRLRQIDGDLEARVTVLSRAVREVYRDAPGRGGPRGDWMEPRPGHRPPPPPGRPLSDHGPSGGPTGGPSGDPGNGRGDRFGLGGGFGRGPGPLAGLRPTGEIAGEILRRGMTLLRRFRYREKRPLCSAQPAGITSRSGIETERR